MLNTRIGENYNANDVINSNDLRKRILNIDSRFRTDCADSTTNFSFRLAHPYKNVIRARVASIEIPNMMYVFSEKKGNTTFKIKTTDFIGIPHLLQIKIPDGNYTSAELVDEIQTQLDSGLKTPYGIFMTVSLNTINAKITFINNGLAPTPISSTTTPSLPARPFILDFIKPSCLNKKDYYPPLGASLGFKGQLYKVEIANPSPPTPYALYSITAENCLDVVGDTYMFLAVNDLYAVDQRTKENIVQVLAKIIVREDRQAVIYDDGATLLSNEIIFPSPVDISLLKVQLLDPWGNVIDLCGINFSFSLEITEVLNTRLYDFYRNYIWLGTIPSVPYKKVTGSAQPLLRGIGPPF